MNSLRTKFYRDKQNAKLMGVCAGIADYTGVNAIWVRLGALMMIGDPDYYGRFWCFTSDATGGWQVPGPVERHRLLARGVRGVRGVV